MLKLRRWLTALAVALLLLNIVSADVADDIATTTATPWKVFRMEKTV